MFPPKNQILSWGNATIVTDSGGCDDGDRWQMVVDVMTDGGGCDDDSDRWWWL